MKILYVEDDKSHREMASSYFYKSQYDLTVVESASEALISLHHGSYDLVITDIMMHPTDGLELAKILNAIYPTTPIILCSCLPKMEMFREYKELPNIIGFISKPPQPEEINTIFAGYNKSAII